MSESQFTIDKQNLTVTHQRLMDATPDRLWAAYTDPYQVQQWWGPRIYTTAIQEV